MRTAISRGNKTYSGKLLKEVQKQVGFAGDKPRFNDLLQCPMSREEYAAHIKGMEESEDEGFAG